MNKDIYVITNDLNNMVYVGQSNNTTLRWQQHINAARKNPKTFVDSEMQRLGIEHFKYSILEANVNSPDERERYWIKKMNSMFPNGYNKRPGGVIGYGGIENSTSKIKSEASLTELVAKIKNTAIPFQEIAKEYGVSTSVISAINLGAAYYKKEWNYPLRNTRYSDELFKRLVYSLKHEKDKSLHDIAIEYEIDESELSAINQGKMRRVDWLTYPIRKGKVANPVYKYAEEIALLLEHSDMPQKDIAQKFNISRTAVSQINYGLSYRQKEKKYPLRENYQGQKTKLCFSPIEIHEIESLLRDRAISMREIGNRYECKVESIMQLNLGAIKKYRNPNIEYPIRKNPCIDYPRIAE